MCRTTRKCHQCKGRYHTSICQTQSTSSAQSGEVPSLAQTEKPANANKLYPSAPPYAPASTTTTLCSDRQQSVLLQTARSVLQNPQKPQKIVEVRLLLDSGSQTGSICKIDAGPTAIHTKLGWVLSGPTSTKGAVGYSVNFTTTHVLRVDAQTEKSMSLDEQLRSFWELESLGIQEEEKTLYDDFTTRVSFRDGRYQVSLPWKEFHEPLPDNYSLCVRG